MSPTNLSTYYFTQGVLGVSVVALAAVCIYLYRQIGKKDDKIFELQNLRLTDSRETTKEVTDVLQANSQSLRILSEKIEVGKSIERANR